MLKCDRFCNELAKAKDPRWEDRLIIIMEVICKMFDLEKGGLSGKYLGGCLAFINVCGRALAATGHAYVISDLIRSDFRLLEGPDWWSTTAERRRKCRERNSPQAATEAEVISHAYQRTGPPCHHDFTLKIFTQTRKKTSLLQRITPVLWFWMSSSISCQTYFWYSFRFHYFYFNKKEELW